MVEFRLDLPFTDSSRSAEPYAGPTVATHIRDNNFSAPAYDGTVLAVADTGAAVDT